MRIVFHELKKIWNLKIIGVTVLLSAMVYVAFLSFYIDHFPNNHHSAADFAYSAMLLERYGNTIEPEDFEDFSRIRDGLLREANSHIAASERLTEIGVYDY